MKESIDSVGRGGLSTFDVEILREWIYVHRRTVVTFAVALAVLIAIAVVGFRPAAARPAVELTLPRAVAPSVSVASPVVIAHVSGAVANAGVFRVAPGSRVGELVDAAGGFAPGADPDRVNLAAVVRDGDQIHIPEVDEQVVDRSGASDSDVVDINHAGQQSLQSLPGIGPALAAAIIEHRDRHGRFATVDELEDVVGIGPATVNRLRDRASV